MSRGVCRECSVKRADHPSLGKHVRAGITRVFTFTDRRKAEQVVADARKQALDAGWELDTTAQAETPTPSPPTSS